MDKKIIFNDFIDIFYSNINKNKMSLHIDFNNASDEIDNSKINIYDIHCVLLELLIAGVNNFSLNLMNDIELNEAIEKLQYFFDNINIIINIVNFSKKDIIDDDSVYESRYMKILSDNPSLIPSAFNQKCPKNYYKGAMVLDPDNTYHFYRMNKDASWTHKPGISKVSSVDASGKKIYVPHFADRDYSNEDDEDSINYTNFCSYYCIPDNKIVHKNLA